MLSVTVIDPRSDKRSAIVARLSELISGDSLDNLVLPPIRYSTLSPHEVKFNSASDITIITSELAVREISVIGTIKKSWPTTVLLVVYEDGEASLALSDRLARLGVDDTLSLLAPNAEILRKIIFLIKRIPQPKIGKIFLVDSGKGGLGVTTIAAGLAECAALAGKKALAVDLDFESQDLSRFLQARPFFNENLFNLISGFRSLTNESLNECVVRIWADDELFCCLSPPCSNSKQLSFEQIRLYVSVLRSLARTYDILIVDVAGIVGDFRHTLEELADYSLYLVNNDPASLYATIDRIKKYSQPEKSYSKVIIQEIVAPFRGLSRKTLKDFFSRNIEGSENLWRPQQIIFEQKVTTWPASGGTIYSLGSQRNRSSIEAIFADYGADALTTTAETPTLDRPLLSFARASLSKFFKSANEAKFVQGVVAKFTKLIGVKKTETSLEGKLIGNVGASAESSRINQPRGRISYEPITQGAKRATGTETTSTPTPNTDEFSLQQLASEYVSGVQLFNNIKGENKNENNWH
ncbi:MAG TPA: AAA family ATPase [Oligoflexia bacterium]|nr:AAA family ATPase [Oligoflexia bacterium]